MFKKPNFTNKLRIVSSGTKIGNQLMMFLLIGVAPIIFPGWVVVPNRIIIFIITASGLATSIFFEAINLYLQKKGKDNTPILNIQLLTSAFLLTLFLVFFGHINGPFFILYLLTIMESYLNKNTKVAKIIVIQMAFFTTIEYFTLIIFKQIAFDFVSLVQFIIKIVSLFFISEYGAILSKNLVAEENARQRAQRTSIKLEATTKALTRANLRLQELSRLKDEFVSIASHELRTPMTAIKSYLWLSLYKNKHKLDKITRRNIEIAYLSTERLISLVQDMLTVSRIEGKRLIIVPTAVNIYKLAQQVKDDLNIKAHEKGIGLEISPPSKPITVRVDEEKIQEVLQNLIGNALKFTPPRGKITVTFQVKDSWVEVSVKDTGPGIADEDQNKLFQKFSRLNNSFAKIAEVAGTGLGLYIAKQIVGLHHGRIWVKSRLGEGSIFTFTLPIKKGGKDGE